MNNDIMASASVSRLIKIFRYAFELPGIEAQWMGQLNQDASGFTLIDVQWGLLGQLVLTRRDYTLTEIKFQAAETADQNEILSFIPFLRQKLTIEQAALSLAEAFGESEKFAWRYAEMLSQMRMTSLGNLIAFLVQSLRIYGVPLASASFPLPVANDAFELVISGTPFQFGSLLVRWSAGAAHSMSASCRFYDLAQQLQVEVIPPIIQQLGVEVADDHGSMEIIAEKLPGDGTLLQIFIRNEEGWSMWQALRIELERYAQICLAKNDWSVENELDPELSGESQPSATKLIAPVLNAELLPWESIPDILNDRKIVFLWHKNLTYRQVAGQLRMNPKTVRNRISTLRKQYTERMVPYRREYKHASRSGHAGTLWDIPNGT